MPEESEEEDVMFATQQDLTGSLSELYQGMSAEAGAKPKGKKRKFSEPKCLLEKPPFFVWLQRCSR